MEKGAKTSLDGSAECCTVGSCECTVELMQTDLEMQSIFMHVKNPFSGESYFLPDFQDYL